jgi:hypothetical protein
MDGDQQPDRTWPADDQWAPPPGTPTWDSPTDGTPDAGGWAPASDTATGGDEWAAAGTTGTEDQWARADGQWAPHSDTTAGDDEWAAVDAAAADDGWAPAADDSWTPPPRSAGDVWPPPAAAPVGGGLPPTEEPWTPAGFRPDWAIEPAGGAAASASPPPTEASAAPPYSGDDAGIGGPASPTDQLADRARTSEAAGGYWPPPPLADPVDRARGERPLPSPAYSAPVSAAYADDPGPVTAPPAGAPSRGRRRGLVAAGAVAVAALLTGAGALLLGGGDDGDGAYTFGTVSSAGDGAVATPAAGEHSHPLDEGETIRTGWVVQTAGDATVALNLARGGVVRFDKGATVSFIDLAVDTRTGKRHGEHKPALQVDGGRIWVNPGGADAASGVRLRLAGGEIVSRYNPVAVDCTVSCRVEAPSGGATLTTTVGRKATPGAGESLDFQDPENLDLANAAHPSEWVRQNLRADDRIELAGPVEADVPSVKAGALVDGSYRLNLSVTGPPTGDDIPADLRHRSGERGNVTLEIDGGECVTLPCDVAVRGPTGLKGTARIEDGTVNITVTQPIPCQGPDKKVIIPDIGDSTLKVALDVLDAEAGDKRWVASSFSGKGTLASTLSKPCSAGETLGTSTSPIAVSAAPAG